MKAWILSLLLIVRFTPWALGKHPTSSLEKSHRKFHFGGARIEDLISDLRIISQDGQRCSASITDGRQVIKDFVKPVGLAANDLASTSTELKQIIEPLTQGADSVLPMLSSTPFVGTAAYRASKYLLRIDSIVRAIEPDLNDFQSAVNQAKFDAKVTTDTLASISDLLWTASNTAERSADNASGSLACCQDLPLLSFACQLAIDSFAETYSPVVERIRETVSMCPSVVETDLTVRPDFEKLEELRSSFQSIVDTAQPFVDMISIASDQDGNETLTDESLALTFQSSSCETTHSVVDPMEKLLTDILPDLAVVFSDQAYAIKVPKVGLGRGILSNEFSCTLENWEIDFEIQEYSFALPSLSFSEQVQQILNGPDPYEGKTFEEDSLSFQETACAP